jgi:hypothetical protein
MGFASHIEAAAFGFAVGVLWILAIYWSSQ